MWRATIWWTSDPEWVWVEFHPPSTAHPRLLSNQNHPLTCNMTSAARAALSSWPSSHPFLFLLSFLLSLYFCLLVDTLLSYYWWSLGHGLPTSVMLHWVKVVSPLHYGLILVWNGQDGLIVSQTLWWRRFSQVGSAFMFVYGWKEGNQKRVLQTSSLFFKIPVYWNLKSVLKWWFKLMLKLQT